MGLFDRFKKKRARSVVVGLDGMPYTMLKALKEKGRLPNLAALLDKGYFGQMSVCIPEISSVSWSSFMTGAQPGQHGIFGFMDLEPGTYKMYFPNFTHLKKPTMWDELGQQGKKSVVINMPSTYPAARINGALVSGFVAVDINKAVSPKEWLPRLKALNYRIDVDTKRARLDHEFLFKDLRETLESRQKAVDLFWSEVDWDLFIVVVTGTDRLMHYVHDAYENQAHKWHDAFMDYLALVDQFAGRIYDRFQQLHKSHNGPGEFFMLSDHGCTGIESEVYINSWLRQHGYLKFKTSQPETISDISDGSVAFALDPSRIYINLRDKYPMGTVCSSDYKRVREELKNGLEQLTFQDNDPILKKVYFKEELYHGPQLNHAPDLIVLPKHGFDIKAKLRTNDVFGRSDLVGMHTQDDAFFYSSNGAACTSIFDVKDIILNSISSKNCS